MWFSVVTCILFAIPTLVVTEDRPSRLVRIDSGPVRGYKDPNEDIFVYYGIPYAKAPSGSERFKAPLPSPIWFEPLEAIDKEIVCPQIIVPMFATANKTMQEDCLIANVFVPNTNVENLPVVVYIHGGGFFIGYGNMSLPKKVVASKKVIAVTFNYRLGPHGFLCLGTEDAPGNAGMKDQVALLRWVRRNIKSFGGNPDDVTIAGASAGSTSVDLLMISKMAKGLFKKGIPESGASLSPYALQVDPIQNAKEYARLLQFNGGNDIYKLQEFFKDTPYDKLQSGNIIHRTDSSFLMAPCVERDIGQERFLEDTPINILKSGDYEKIPILFGFANMEGLIRIDIFDSWKDQMNIKFSDYLPPDLQFLNDQEKEQVANKIKIFYFGNKNVSDDSVLDYVNYFTDVFFACPTLRSIDLQLQAGNDHIYLYEYSFVDDTTPVVPYTQVRGANHCAQSAAVFDGANIIVPDETDITEDLRTMKSIIRELWINFITSGKPSSEEVSEWPPVGSDYSPHMVLNIKPELRGSLLKERCQLWQDVFDKYYRPPIPPSSIPIQNTEL